tara:strand:+ start:252 stop:872 length:621 start_codon:yes stop_codon:yes gene_type:complete
MALYQLLTDVADDDLIESVKTHCNDAENGEYPPKPSHLRAILCEIDARHARERDQRLKAEEEEYNVDTPQSRVVKASARARRQMGHAEFKVRPSRCELCTETGFRPYYLPKEFKSPSDKFEVYEESEYLEKPEEERGDYRLYRAVCNCKAGKLKRARYAGIIKGVVSEGKYFRSWPLIEEVERMAAQRRQKEARLVGEVSGGADRL